MKIIQMGRYRGLQWYIQQTNSGQLGSAVDFQMVVPGVFKSDYFRSVEKWSIDRELTQAKSFIDEAVNTSDALQLDNITRANRGEVIGE